MSIFKKLFGASACAPAVGDRPLIPRQPRVKIGPLHRIEFVKTGARHARLCNVSSQGMGVMREDLPDVKAGDELTGDLKIGEREFPVAAQVRHASGDIVGCRFANVVEPLSRAVEEYFRIEILGLKLRRINPQYMKADPDGQAEWFTDGGPNELYFVMGDGDEKVRRFHMSVFGYYLEGADGKTVRTGSLADDPAAGGGDGGRVKGTTLVDVSASSSRQAIELARQLIRNVPEMSAAHRDALEALLGNSGLKAL